MFIPFDPYYLILVIPALLFAGWAQMSVSSAFNRYSRVRNMHGMTGAQAARRILDDNGLQNVRVEHIGGRWCACPTAFTRVIQSRRSAWPPMNAAMRFSTRVITRR